MIIDIHTHYTLSARAAASNDRFSFETVTDPAEQLPSGFDSCIAPRAWRRVTWQIARRVFGLPSAGAGLDQRLEAFYAEQLHAAGPIDRHVLLAFDAYFNDAGQMTPLPISRRDRGVDIYTSNTLVWALCREQPQRFLFGGSVHPYRPDALAALDEVFAAGASLIKLMPLHHNIDPQDERTRRFCAHAASLGLPLLLHVGPEFMLQTQHAAYAELAPFLELFAELEQRGDMPPVIIAHVATPVSPLGPWRHYRLLLDALRGHFRTAPLYADVSALTAWGKLPALSHLRQQPALHRKLLFGSDFPVPPARAWLARRYAPAAFDAPWPTSWPQFAARALQNAGFLDGVFTQAAGLLPNVGAFASPGPDTA